VSDVSALVEHSWSLVASKDDALMEFIVIIHTYTTHMIVAYKGPFHTRKQADTYAAGIDPGEFPDAQTVVIPLQRP
jgi:hypothetical protein